MSARLSAPMGHALSKVQAGGGDWVYFDRFDRATVLALHRRGLVTFREAKTDSFGRQRFVGATEARLTAPGPVPTTTEEASYETL